MQRKVWRKVGLAVVLCAACMIASAQSGSFDTSGNKMLLGDYFVRQVLLQADQNTSAVTRSASLTGIMTFDGNGKYTFTGQLLDTKVGTAPQAYNTSGNYSVASNGLAQIVNPIDNTDQEFGAVAAVGPNAIVASATEGSYSDIFVAIPAGTGVSNKSISGSYQAGFIDFLQGNASNVRDGYFQMTADGNGNLGNIQVSGAAANQNNSNTEQTLNGVTYSISGTNGSGTLTFPTASDPTTALVSGQKTLYVSKDGNIILGGSFNGYDLIVGTKSGSGITNANFNGTYFLGALENDTSSSLCQNPNCIDSFSGSTHANGQGIAITHWRLRPFAVAAYDYTTDASYNFPAGGAYNDGQIEWILGGNNQVVLQVGSGTTYTLTVGFRAPDFSGSGVFLNPIGIVNSASFAPITNSVAPGEYVSLFGSGLAPGNEQASSLPLPTTSANGVQVTVNGAAAPLYYVTPTQIIVQVPYEITADNFATFKVINNGTSSNAVTVYTATTSPGVFTQTADGVGAADVFHLDYTPVTQSNPAAVGETLFMYANGLGQTNPAATTGAAPPSSPSQLVNDQAFGLDIFDSKGNLTSIDSANANFFAGLAPGFPGVYQINFVVPTGVASGDAYLDINTTEAYTTEAHIFIK